MTGPAIGSAVLPAIGPATGPGTYQKQPFWSGFEFREARKGAKAKSYSELKDDDEFRKNFSK